VSLLHLLWVSLLAFVGLFAIFDGTLFFFWESHLHVLWVSFAWSLWHLLLGLCVVQVQRQLALGSLWEDEKEYDPRSHVLHDSFISGCHNSFNMVDMTRSYVCLCRKLGNLSVTV